MKKTLAVLAFLAVLVLILTPAVIGVNANRNCRSTAWADGSVPPPPFPSRALIIHWADGSVPPPPFPS